VLETSDYEFCFVKYEVAIFYSAKLAELLEGVILKKMRVIAFLSPLWLSGLTTSVLFARHF
jgi:hypothetical protein